MFKNEHFEFCPHFGVSHPDIIPHHIQSAETEWNHRLEMEIEWIYLVTYYLEHKTNINSWHIVL